MIECRKVGLDFYETAPQRYVFERELGCTPQKLFEIFDDENSWPQWAPGLSKVTWTSERPFGVGTTRTVRFPDGTEVYEEFIAWEDGKRMAFCLEGASKKIWWSFGENYQVTDLGEGRCKLVWTVAYEPRFVLKYIHPLAKPMMRWFLGKIANGLVEYVDALPASVQQQGESSATAA